MANTPESIDVQVNAIDTTDWYSMELPNAETDPEEIGIDPEDIQSWITNEYSMISLLDEVIEDFQSLRTMTKSRVDIMVKLAGTVERLQAELLADGDEEEDEAGF